MRTIDMSSSPRAGLFAHYLTYANPAFTLCTSLGVDAARWKDAEGGMFLNILWAVLASAQAVPELRQRLREEGGRYSVVEHDRVDCTCTAARPDGSFTFAHVDAIADREVFVRAARGSVEAAIGATGLDLSQQGRDDLLYVSSVPWYDIVGVSHAMPGGKGDWIPRILWGRVVDDRMTLCLTAHHSLVDGLHMGRFFSGVEERLSAGS